MGDNLKIPEGSSQPKNVYLEQIEILKPILKLNDKLPTSAAKESEKKNVSQDGNSKKHAAKEYSMPDLDLLASTSQGKRVSAKGKTTCGSTNDEMVIAQPGTMLEKLQKAAPYNLFFTTIIKAPQTQQQPNAITFTGKFLMFHILQFVISWYPHSGTLGSKE